jgi:hypothetical protein
MIILSENFISRIRKRYVNFQRLLKTISALSKVVFKIVLVHCCSESKSAIRILKYVNFGGFMKAGMDTGGNYQKQ